jgi:P27 family predicted phage terminase small subunit
MRGRKPKPLALRRLHGHTSHSTPPLVDAPEGVGLVGLPPDWFDDEQRAQWNSVLERAPIGLLTETDREVVITFCVASVEYRRAVEDVRRNGQVCLSSKRRPTVNPSVRIMNAMAATMLQTGALIGFSPTARASLGRVGQRSPGQIAGGKLADYLAADPDRLDH